MFPYRWSLSDGYPAQGIKPHGKTVFGTFVCGGGSTMGYKLAGYYHLGGVELDPRIAKVYKENHSPENLYIEDIRTFNERDDLPDSLYNLDLLDGSPPCSSFSMAGNREKDWGKNKKFQEGQSKQVLDDLVYVYADTINKLQPKVAILENVKGLITGNAKTYAKEIKKRITAAGYRVQLFLLNSATMGVPQVRERVFFVCLRNDIDLPRLELDFNESPIIYGEIEDKDDTEDVSLGPVSDSVWPKVPKGNNFSVIAGSNSLFSHYKVSPDKSLLTIVSGSGYYHYKVKRHLNAKELTLAGSFPSDYNYLTDKWSTIQNLVGMSVPPVMTAQIANQIYIQWLSKCST